MLDKLSSSLHSALRKILSAPIVDKGTVRELVIDVQRALLQADVNVHLVLDLTKNIEKRILGEEMPPGISRHEHTVKVVYEELTKLLGNKTPELRLEKGKKALLMLVGIQGCGKTVSVAKLANYLKKRGFKPALICTDTYRPGAYAQLRQLADMINVPIYGEGKNSIEIALNGIKKFDKDGRDVIIIDTAGRHKEEVGLMKEMKAMAERIEPDEIILVVDGTIGQQAYAQAKAFHEATEIGSIFVTKLDSSAKGGGAVSAVAATGAELKFIGTGEGLDDVEMFDPPRFIGKLLGLGDIKGLLERVKEAEIKPEMEARAILEGRFTLDDLFEQIRSIKKMGSMKQILKMIPGFGYAFPEEAVDITESKLEKWSYIVQSMTKEEKADPNLIKGSRLRRVAYGSGVSEKDVRELLQYYSLIKKSLRRILKHRKRLSSLDKLFGLRTG